MVYSSNFVLCIKKRCDGKVQREQFRDGFQTVELSEGDEYIVRLRNKNNKRAACELIIDGEYQGNFVVDPNSYIDVERSVQRNAGFKFTSINSPDAVDAGKNIVNFNSGLITAKFKFERTDYQYQQWVYGPFKYSNDYPYYSNLPISVSYGNNIVKSCSLQNLSTNIPQNCSSPNPNIGVTVDGGKTNQNFHSTYFPLEYSYAAILNVKLVLANDLADQMKEVMQNEINKGKNIYCSQCGTSRESHKARFCVNCGHKLGK